MLMPSLIQIGPLDSLNSSGYIREWTNTHKVKNIYNKKWFTNWSCGVRKMKKKNNTWLVKKEKAYMFMKTSPLSWCPAAEVDKDYV